MNPRTLIVYLFYFLCVVFICSSCNSSSYMNTKVSVPVFKDSSMLIGTTYIGTRKIEANASYSFLKKLYVTGAISNVWFGSKGTSLDLGLGYVPIKKKTFHWNIHGMYGFTKMNYKDDNTAIPIFDIRIVRKASLNTKYEKLNITTYCSYVGSKRLTVSLGVRSNYVKYGEFINTTIFSDDPGRANMTATTLSDTVIFRNKGFATLDPFINYSSKISKHFGFNIQVLYSFSRNLEVEGILNERKTYDRTTVLNETSIVSVTYPKYKRLLFNIGLYFDF